jgi:hypothetical protein
MKSCPKCNRTFPDEGQKFCTFDGGLLIAPQTFDPNVTIRATVADGASVTENSTSRDLPDPNATIVESPFASTVALPRNTAPTSTPLTGDFQGSTPPPSIPAQDQTVALTPPLPPPPVQAPPPVVAQQPPPPPAVAAVAAGTPTGPVTAAPVKKKSKAPLIIVGVLLFLLLGGGALAAVFFFVVKPKLDEMKAQRQTENPPVVTTTPNANTETKPVEQTTPTPEVDNYTPPPGTTAFENSNGRLDGKLAEHYFDFSFYYPESWQKDAKAGVPGATKFVEVQRRLPSAPDFTQENFTVSWYTSAGTYDLDLPNYPKRVEEFSTGLAKNIPEYRKVSEGPTTVNKMKAYEFRYEGFSKNTDQGDLKIFGRVVFLPTGKEGDTTGATLTMLSTSLAPELESVNDLGVKGEAPVILESFRFGKKK